MGKNAKKQKARIFGKNSSPVSGSAMRNKHMQHVHDWVLNRIGLENRVTPGKVNAAGKYIKKPDWTSGYLEYEPNPDAAVHEVAHLFLAKIGLSLGSIQRDMDKQFGYSQSVNGYMKQKRSVFEVLPMGVEQKIRRRLGLPASRHGVIVQDGDPPRLEIETGRPCANRVKLKNGKFKDLIRCAKNVDSGALDRLEQIDNGELKFCAFRGWYKCQSVNAKINRRARLRRKTGQGVAELRRVA